MKYNIKNKNPYDVEVSFSGVDFLELDKNNELNFNLNEGNDYSVSVKYSKNLFFNSVFPKGKINQKGKNLSIILSESAKIDLSTLNRKIKFSNKNFNFVFSKE